jgi:hypothetical protein
MQADLNTAASIMHQLLALVAGFPNPERLVDAGRLIESQKGHAAEIETLREARDQAVTEMGNLYAQLRAVAGERDAALAQVRDLQEWWFAPIRSELGGSVYAQAVAAQDTAAVFAVFALLTAKSEQSMPDEIPVDTIRRELSGLAARVELLPSSETYTEQVRDQWRRVVAAQTTIVGQVAVSVPRSSVTGLVAAATAVGLFPPGYQFGVVTRSALDRLGLAEVVTAPAHVARAMGW